MPKPKLMKKQKFLETLDMYYAYFAENSVIQNERYINLLTSLTQLKSNLNGIEADKFTNVNTKQFLEAVIPVLDEYYKGIGQFYSDDTMEMSNHLRNVANYKNLKGYFETVINSVELSKIESKYSLERMYTKEEFPSNSIPEYLVNGGTLEQLADYQINHPNASQQDKNYIADRIESEIFFNDLEYQRDSFEKKTTSLKTQGDRIILNDIYQDSHQTTINGCYSCSASLLLQSKGLSLTQRQVRAYRSKGSFIDKEARTRMQTDKVGSIIDIGGIITKNIPNTAVCEKTFENNARTGDAKRTIHEELKKLVIDSIEKKKSPVSLLINSHYTTIVGYDKKTDKIIYKDSNNRENPANTNYENITLAEIANQNKKISVTYLVDIDPMKPTANFNDVEGIEHINGQYFQNDDRNIGLPEAAPDPEGKTFSIRKDLGKGAVVFTNLKLPNSLVPTPEMKKEGYEFPKVKPASKDDTKRYVLNALKERQNQIIPNDNKIEIKGEIKGGKYEFTFFAHKSNDTSTVINKYDFGKYLYYQQLIDNIDIMTPMQVDNCLSPEKINDMSHYFMDESAIVIDNLSMYAGKKPFAPILFHYEIDKFDKEAFEKIDASELDKKENKIENKEQKKKFEDEFKKKQEEVKTQILNENKNLNSIVNNLGKKENKIPTKLNQEKINNIQTQEIKTNQTKTPVKKTITQTIIDTIITPEKNVVMPLDNYIRKQPLKNETKAPENKEVTQPVNTTIKAPENKEVTQPVNTTINTPENKVVTQPDNNEIKATENTVKTEEVKVPDNTVKTEEVKVPDNTVKTEEVKAPENAGPAPSKIHEKVKDMVKDGYINKKLYMENITDELKISMKTKDYKIISNALLRLSYLKNTTDDQVPIDDPKMDQYVKDGLEKAVQKFTKISDDPEFNWKLDNALKNAVPSALYNVLEEHTKNEIHVKEILEQIAQEIPDEVEVDPDRKLEEKKNDYNDYTSDETKEKIQKKQEQFKFMM